MPNTKTILASLKQIEQPTTLLVDDGDQPVCIDTMVAARGIINNCQKPIKEKLKDLNKLNLHVKQPLAKASLANLTQAAYDNDHKPKFEWSPNIGAYIHITPLSAKEMQAVA